jgi:hypothetical protein
LAWRTIQRYHDETLLPTWTPSLFSTYYLSHPLFHLVYAPAIFPLGLRTHLYLGLCTRYSHLGLRTHYFYLGLHTRYFFGFTHPLFYLGLCTCHLSFGTMHPPSFIWDYAPTILYLGFYAP